MPPADDAMGLPRPPSRAGAPGGAPPEVVGAGLVVRDLVAELDGFPEPDEKSRARAFHESTGGPVPTALVALARLGRSTAFAGVIGSDVAGDAIAADLVAQGLDVTALVRRRGFRTPSAIVLVEGPRRTVVECFDLGLPLVLPHLERTGILERLGRARALLVDARLPGVQLDLAARVRAAGGLVVVDVGHPRQGVHELLAHSDVAFLSSSYPRHLQGPGYDVRGFLEELVGRLPVDGPRVAGLTLGAGGSVFLDPAPPGPGARRPLVHVPALAVEVRDSTGAGDVFHGALTHALLRDRAGAPLGRDALIEAVRFANATAAFACRGMTGRAPFPGEDEIRAAAATLEPRIERA